VTTLVLRCEVRRDGLRMVHAARFTSRIAEHDLEVKTNKVLEFLSKGYLVKVSVAIQVRCHERIHRYVVATAFQHSTPTCAASPKRPPPLQVVAL
jgi:translation initiation factor IF-3